MPPTLPVLPTPRAGTPAEGRELRARGQRTVRGLLDAAVDVLAKRGYHATRVDDIVTAAGASHGTFYLYFANKEDLFRSLLLDVADAIGLHSSRLGDLSDQAALREWIGGFGELYRHYAPVIRAWVEAEIDTHEFGQLGAELLGGLAGVLAERIEAAGPKAAVLDPTNAAVVIVGMIERSYYYATVGQIRAKPDALADTLTNAVHAAIFGG